MIINCPNCNIKYSINKNILGKNGKKVKCSDCGHEWYEKQDIVNKDLEKQVLEDKEQTSSFINKEIKEKKLFVSEKKNKIYKILYFLIFILLVVIIFLKKDYFYNLLKENSQFIKDELISKKNNNNDSFSLVFNQIQKEVSILNNNKKVIKIFGKISNTSNSEIHKIPKIKATLFDDKNNIVTSWFFFAEKKILKPQESLNFNTSYIHENKDIADIKIEFDKGYK